MKGHHKYPFRFELPCDLPDTLEDSRYVKLIHVAGSNQHFHKWFSLNILSQTSHILSENIDSYWRDCESGQGDH